MEKETDNIAIKRTANSIEAFNHTHYHKVWKARREIGDNLGNLDQPNHSLVGKKLRNRKTGDIYNVESVKKQFYAGWYFGALLECNNSHCFAWFHNESSIDSIVEKHCIEFWEDFEEVK